MKYLIKHKTYGFLISVRNKGLTAKYAVKIKDAKAYTTDEADFTINKLVKAGEHKSNLDKLVY